MFRFVFLALILSGCTSSSGVIPDGKDAYRILHTGDTGFTNSGTLQKNTYKEASAFCDKQGKIVETITMDSKQSRPLGGWPEANLLFKCVSRDEVQNNDKLNLYKLKDDLDKKVSYAMANANQHARCYVLASTMGDSLLANLHYAHGTYVLEKPYFDAVANEEKEKLLVKGFLPKDLGSFAFKRYNNNCKHLDLGASN